MPTSNGRMPGVEGRDGKFPGPSLIPALYAIQDEHGWLPREELVKLSRDMRRPLYEIEGITSFYPHFRTEPPAKVDLHVCRDLSCWLRGAEERIAEIHTRYGDDVEVEVREVSCLGRCDFAPAVAVSDHPANVEETDRLVADARSGSLSEAAAPRSGERWDNDPYSSPDEHYGVLRRALSGELEHEQIVAALQESELRGMGGAGFPTGKKWELVAAQESTPKYAVCNADESEPGAFKDRQVLAEQPHLVLEGLLLGMFVCGCEQGWVFIRHEYGPEEAVLREELATLRAAGLLGDDVRGSGRRLELDVFVSPGGYILGEESALLECMEGHRGEPRNKPPFPGIYGLHGQPTLMNSVETLAFVPVIIERGGEWWQAQGKNGQSGLKYFCISGHVEHPGVYLVPMGTTMRELLDQAGGVKDGAELQAFQPGGASSNFLAPDKLDTPLSFDTLQEVGSMLGAGAPVIVAEGTNLLAAGTNVLRFFRDESCGKCVPCRVGSGKAHTILTGLLEQGLGADAVDERVIELEKTLRLTSICGLGQVALGPVASVIGLSRGGSAVPERPDAPESQ